MWRFLVILGVSIGGQNGWFATFLKACALRIIVIWPMWPRRIWLGHMIFWHRVVPTPLGR
jgi:hypothetical protein